MMPETPLYESHYVPDKLPAQGNAGLWWNKFFSFYEDDFTEVTPAVTQKDREKPDGKTRWINTVEGTSGQHQHIERFARRQFDLGAAQGAQQKCFKTNWHLATGLGYSYPVENGFCWHPTLGVPYLPASSIKGLLRAWMEKWEEFANENMRNKVLESWFGNKQKEDKHDDLRAGSLIFFDAVPVQSPELSADVMTPHMGKWYAEGSEIKNANGSGSDAARVPGDWHAPVPVPFLVVSRASFLFQIAARPKSTFEGGYDPAKAMDLLQLALEHLGIGAKTAAGYGRMIEDSEVLEKWEKRREQEAQKLIKQQEREAKRRAAEAIKETEETVEMIAEPNIAEGSVMIRTESGEEFECANVLAYVAGETPLGRWAGDEDERKLTAKITRKNGVITKVLFVEWF